VPQVAEKILFHRARDGIRGTPQSIDMMRMLSAAGIILCVACSSAPPAGSSTGSPAESSSSTGSSGTGSSSTGGGSSSGKSTGGGSATGGACGDGGTNLTLQQVCFDYVGGIHALFAQGQACGVSLVESETLDQCEAQYAVCQSCDWIVIDDVASCIDDLVCEGSDASMSSFSLALSKCVSVFSQATTDCAAVGFGAYGDGGL
jgi:hypothetical protein